MGVKEVCKESAVIARYHILDNILSKRTVALLFIYVIAFFIGLKLADLVGVMQLLLGVSVEIPTFIFIPVKISIYLLPFFALLLSYRSIAGEIETGTAKCLFPKINRISLILGSFLSNVFLLFVLNVIMYTGTSIFVYTQLGQIMVIPFLIIALYLTLFAALFVTLSTFISTILNTTQNVLQMGLLVYFVLLLGDFITWLQPYSIFRLGTLLFEFMKDNAQATLSGTYIIVSLAVFIIIVTALMLWRKNI